MKKIIISILVAATLFSCKTTKKPQPYHVCTDTTHQTCDGWCSCDGMGCGKPRCKHTIYKSIVLIPDEVRRDERPTFTVIFEDEKVIQYMYPEEIANSLITGVWEYNEDLRVQ